VILVDTHVVLWLAFQPEKVSDNAKREMDIARETGGGLAISGITLLELAGLASKGRFETFGNIDTFLDSIEAKFAVLPITARACSRTVTLPKNYPKDPADRIIGATAMVEDIPLVTADRDIRRATAIRTIW